MEDEDQNGIDVDVEEDCVVYGLVQEQDLEDGVLEGEQDVVDEQHGVLQVLEICMVEHGEVLEPGKLDDVVQGEEWYSGQDDEHLDEHHGG